MPSANLMWSQFDTIDLISSNVTPVCWSFPLCGSLFALNGAYISAYDFLSWCVEQERHTDPRIQHRLGQRDLLPKYAHHPAPLGIANIQSFVELLQQECLKARVPHFFHWMRRLSYIQDYISQPFFTLWEKIVHCSRHPGFICRHIMTIVK